MRSQGDERLVELQEVEGWGPCGFEVDEVESQYGHQHQNASGHSVNEKLNGRIDPPPGITPYPNEKIHGDEHHLPKDIEQDEIQRDEGSHHSRLQKEEGDHVLLDPHGDGAPGTENAENSQEGGQQDEQQAYPVDSQVVTDPIFRNPLCPLDELHPHFLWIEGEEQGEGNDELHQGKDEGYSPYGGVILLVHEQKDNRPYNW